jgi:hypothetical protein
MRRVLVAVLLGLLVTVTGCGPGGVTVSGTVTLDGEPLKEGHIVFRPVPALAKSEAIGGPIKDGKYQVKARPGQNRVEITATRVVPGTKDSFGNPLQESIIPERYNVESNLTKEISASGANEFNVELTSR